MSLTILFGGQRKKIKFQAQTSTIQVIVEEAALAYQLDPLQCNLVHNRKTLDKGQLFRFSGVSNNATLELIVKNKSRSQGIQEVKIALSAEDLGSHTTVISSNQSLREVLQKFMEIEGFLPQDLLLRSPVVVYLRQQFVGEQLETTLQSLGLGSAGARLQLRYDKDPPPISCLPEEPEDIKKDVSSDNMEVVSPVEIVEKVSDAEEIPISLPSNSPAQPNQTLSTPPKVDTVSNPFLQVEDTSVEHITTEDAVPTVEGILSQCQQMLNSNFDCVSTPAIITITKYLDNLIKHPENLKYRTINTQNAIFAENILPAKGAIDILFGIGFHPHPPRYLMLPPSPHKSSQQTPTKLYFQFETISESDGIVTTKLLKAIRENVCEVIMNDLNIPEEKRPPRPISPSESPQSNATPVIPFDPFKPLIIRTSIQPRPPNTAEVMSNDGAMVIPIATEWKSETEVKLDKLIQKRDQLMGDRLGVERRTKISLLLSSSHDQSNADPKFNGTSMEVEVEDPNSDSVALRYMMKKYAKANDLDENSPLTTKAIRDLEKIQKEVVYTQTLIKIRFPDRICLEAYFHPQDTIQDIRSWLLESCLLPSPPNFDLYITPPRTVLPLNTTLQESKLVPAAVVYLSWQTPPTGDASAGDRELLLPGCSYLTTDLYRKANSLYSSEEIKGGSSPVLEDKEEESLTHQFPRGEKLVKEPEKVKHGLSTDSDTKGGESDSKERKPGSGMKKPRWLKT